MLKRLLIWLVCVALLAPLTAAAQATDKTKETGKSKIDSAIIKVMNSVAARQGSSIQTARALGVPFDGNSVTITLVFDPQRSRGASASQVSGAVVQVFGTSSVIASQSRTLVRLKVPLNLVPLIELLTMFIPEISYIRPPLVPQTLALSEGVALTGAEALHNAGNLGQGAKVAVIDLGFAGFANARSRGELPANVVTRDFSGTGLEFGTAHGTAVAEIVHDMAPNAQLFLYKVSDEVDLENAVNEAITQGIDIINHSVGWFNTSYYDGTGTIADIIQPAISAGILWVNSAGNYAKRHYKGMFRDSNANGFTEFAGSDETLDIQANAGETIHLYLTWRDWPMTAQDYDLILENVQGDTVAISDKTQNGGQEPTESLRYFVPSSGTYRVRVQAFSGNAAKELTLFSLNHDLEHAVAQSSIVTPADVNGVLSVAAIRQENWNSGPQADYSSQGPTNDGRAKPDISGPDNVQTLTFGAFEGTSAAAPHVAGAAALLLSQNPGLSGPQLSSQLRSSASAVGSVLATGAGRVTLSAPAPPQRPDLSILNTDFSPRTPTIGDVVQHQITIANQSSASAGAFVVRLRDQNGTTQQTLSGLAAGASVTVSFTRALTTPLDTITVTVDAAQQVDESNENNNTAQYQIQGQAQPPENRAPSASFTFTPANPQPGQTVNFDASGSSDPDGQISRYEWDFDNNGTVDGFGRQARASYGRVGTFSVRLTVTDNQGASASTTRTLTVQASAPPPNTAPQGTIQTDKQTYQLGEALQIHFSTDTQAYAYIYNVDASGQVSQVFPNVFSQNNQLSPGNYTLPDGNYRFTVTGPMGTESLHLLLSLSPVDPGVDGLRNSQYTNAALFSQALQSRVAGQLANDTWSTEMTTFQVGAAQPPENRAPSASFTFTPANPQPGQTVNFDASGSSDPDGQISRYEWDFDNNGTVDGFGRQVRARYGRAGTFSVRLTVTDNQGASASTTRTLTVQAVQPTNQPPTASFTFTPANPQPGQTVNFDASGSSDPDGQITQYTWDLDGNGSPDAFGQRASRSFPVTGTFTVRLTVTDNRGASASSVQTIQVRSAPANQPPVAQFTFSPNQPLTGDRVVFDASGSTDPDGIIVDYRWDLNSDGQIDVNGVRVAARFNTAQEYVATLTVVDNQGASASTRQTIRVGQVQPTNQPPQASFTHSPNVPQTGQTVSFDARGSFDPDGSIVEYRWDFDGNGTQDAQGAVVNHQFMTAGSVVVTLTVVDNGGLTHSAQQAITIGAAPPSPTPSQGPIPAGLPGIFILGESTQLHVVVQGDPSWTTARSFKIVMETNTALANPQQQVQGDASGSVNIPSNSDVSISGSVGNGRIDFFLNQFGPAGAIKFDVTFDVNGDGKRERNTPYIVIGNQRFKASRNPFTLVAHPSGEQVAFPFAGKTLYTCSTSYRRGQFQSCVRVGG